MLALATLLTVMDSVAKGVENFGTALGVVGNEAGTIANAAAANRDLLAALDDQTVQVDLTGAFARRASMVRGTGLYLVLQGAMLQRALDRHYGAAGNGDLNAFLKNNDARLHPNLRLIGIQLDARNAFAPTVVDPVASYLGTGAGAGIFTAGADLDTTAYGEAALQVVVTLQGAAARTLRLTLKNFDGTTETRDVVIAGNAPNGTVYAVGAGADRYVGVSGMATIGGGGQLNDAVHVRSTIERVIAL